MSVVCAELHALARRGTVHSFPFDITRLPVDGIYALFEAGEECHAGARIVRVGTHTGDRQLRSRMLQHFVNEDKDRSIFRKNIGRALLNRDGDPYLTEWERDRTSRPNRAHYGEEPDAAKRRARLTLESKMISTLSRCEECKPADRWLGLHSLKDRIRQSGLWLVNELYKEPLSSEDLARLAMLLT